ncbi:MAG: hypothetical protein AAFP10_02340 [Pseudomonadota bacterium]
MLNLQNSIKLDTESLKLFINNPNFGLIDSEAESLVTYAESADFLSKALKKSNLRFVFSKDFGFKDKRIIIVDNPGYVFWSLAEFNSRIFYNNLSPTIIHEKAVVEDGAMVSKHGVIISSGSIIRSGARILPNVKIGKNCDIGQNSIIGSDGFQVKDTAFGYVRIKHDAGVIINDEVEVGGLCTINAGLLGHATKIDEKAKIDCKVHVAHSCCIGSKCVIAANATLGGNSVLKSSIFVGLNAVIVNRVHVASNSYIAANATVARSILTPVKVIGFPGKEIRL